MSAYLHYSYLVQHPDWVAPRVRVENRFSIFANFKRYMFGVNRHVSNKEETVVHAFVDNGDHNILLNDGMTSMESSLDDETENFGKCPKTTDRVVRKRFKVPYMQRVVRELRIEFPFLTTPYTKSNYGAIHYKASSIMKAHGIRTTLIGGLAAQITSLYFVPNRDDIAAQNYMDSAEMMLANLEFHSSAYNKSTPISNVVRKVVPRFGNSTRRGFVPEQ
jgi:hypothetical protein